MNVHDAHVHETPKSCLTEHMDQQPQVGAEEEEALKKQLEEAQRLNQEVEGDDDEDEDGDD